eukprot:m.177649 g.177649  ORF g.177649 m.177649 type:complete len:495 (+) comp13550_c1_seq3:145-1629(+)
MSHDPTEQFEQKDGLTVSTFYLECLAHGSYIVSHEGNAFLIDPRRDIEIYTEFLEKHKLKLKGVLESHLHADFVSGHMELHKKFGTTIFIGENAGAQFPHYPTGEGDVLGLSSKYIFKAIPTPGHTFGCVTWVVVNKETNKEVMAFTGDTLFVGGVGRPDLVGALLPDATPEKLSSNMFHSLKRLMTLPDECLVFPAHGPGSPCGKGISADLSSTIGKEKDTNEALLYTDEQKFIEWNTSGLEAAPQYFPNAVLTNMSGAENVKEELAKIPSLKMSEAVTAMANGAVLLDTRSAEAFAQKHAPQAINIPLGGGGGVHLEYEDGNFAIWVGTLIPAGKDIVLIAAEDKRVEAMERLGRIGYAKQIKGLVDCDCDAWVESGAEVESFKKVTITSVKDVEDVKEQGYTFVDTRTAGEYDCPLRGHVKGALNFPLAQLEESCQAMDKKGKYVVYCLGGFRSAIATSILLKNGFNATDVYNGYERGVLATAKGATTAHQ